MKQHVIDATAAVKTVGYQAPVLVAATSFLGFVQWSDVLYAVSAIWVLVQMSGYLYDRYKRNKTK